jgi:hypothetical protein
MPLHSELLKQAAALANSDESEAASRRAASSAYYALFHFLTSDAVERMVPPTPVPLRLQDRRAFTHAGMRDVCKEFAKGIPGSLHPSTRGLISPPIDPDLAAVAENFVALQEARHKADYDLGFKTTQLGALEKIGRAEVAFNCWNNVRSTPNASVFLVALALQRHWQRSS